MKRKRVFKFDPGFGAAFSFLEEGRGEGGKGKGKEGGNWEGETPKTWIELETKKIVANNTFCQKVPIL